MGKNDQQKPPWHKDAYWSYWHGSWKQRTPKAKGRNMEGGSDDNQFPGYDTMSISATSSTAAMLVSSNPAADQLGGPGQDYLKAVQKSINSNRRIEGRLRKIAEDVDTKKQQWKAFEKHVQTVFLQQKRQFQQDMDGLAKEAKDLELQRVAALQQLMETVESRRDAGSQDACMTEADHQDTAAWNELVGAADSTCLDSDQSLAQAFVAAQTPEAFAQFLHTQLHAHPLASGPGIATTPRPGPAMTPRSPMLPPRPAIRQPGVALPPGDGMPVATPTMPSHVPLASAPAPLPSFGPPGPSPCGFGTAAPPMSGVGALELGYASHSPPAATDPYMQGLSTSPLASHAVTQTAPAPATGPTARPLTPRPRKPSAKIGERLPIKVVSKTVPLTATQCLQAANLAREEALERRRTQSPAMVPAEPEHPPDVVSSSASGHAGPAHISLVDDDVDTPNSRTSSASERPAFF